MQKQLMDDKTAESVFNSIISSRRKLTMRNWDSDVFKEEKQTIIKLIKIGAIKWDNDKKCIIYILEDQTLGDKKEVEFVSRDSIKMRQDALAEAKTEEDKGIAIVCAYAQLKKHQYVELSSSDEEYVTMIFQLFLA
jgi:hypothetical protein